MPPRLTHIPKRPVWVGCSVKVHLVVGPGPTEGAHTLCGLGGALGGPVRSSSRRASCERCLHRLEEMESELESAREGVR